MPWGCEISGGFLCCLWMGRGCCSQALGSQTATPLLAHRCEIFEGCERFPTRALGFILALFNPATIRILERGQYCQQNAQKSTSPELDVNRNKNCNLSCNLSSNTNTTSTTACPTGWGIDDATGRHGRAGLSPYITTVRPNSVAVSICNALAYDAQFSAT